MNLIKLTVINIILFNSATYDFNNYQNGRINSVMSNFIQINYVLMTGRSTPSTTKATMAAACSANFLLVALQPKWYIITTIIIIQQGGREKGLSSFLSVINQYFTYQQLELYLSSPKVSTDLNILSRLLSICMMKKHQQALAMP